MAPLHDSDEEPILQVVPRKWGSARHRQAWVCKRSGYKYRCRQIPDATGRHPPSGAAAVVLNGSFFPSL